MPKTSAFPCILVWKVVLLCPLPNKFSPWLIQIWGHILTATLCSTVWVGRRGCWCFADVYARTHAKKQRQGTFRQPGCTQTWNDLCLERVCWWTLWWVWVVDVRFGSPLAFSVCFRNPWMDGNSSDVKVGNRGDVSCCHTFVFPVMTYFCSLSPSHPSCKQKRVH